MGFPTVLGQSPDPRASHPVPVQGAAHGSGENWPVDLGWMSSMHRSLFMTQNGGVVGEESHGGRRQPKPTWQDTGTALWRPFVLTEDGGNGDAGPTAPHVRTPELARVPAAGASATSTGRRLDPETSVPALLRPFYLSQDGGYIRGTGSSSVVSSMRWLDDTVPANSAQWGSTLEQSLTMSANGDGRPNPNAARMVDHEESAERLPSPDGGLDPNDAAPALPTDGANKKSADDEKGIGGDKKLGSPPEDNSLQFLRFSTVLLEPGKLQTDIGFLYSLSETQIPVAAGPDDVAPGILRQRQLTIPVEFRFGLTRRMQTFVAMPVGWSNTELSLPGFDEFENDGGIGDLRGGFTYLVKEGKDGGPDVTATFAFTAPTGNGRFFLGNTLVQPAGLGDGFWSLSGDLLVIHHYDPVVMFYGFGTRHRFERSVQDTLVAPGGEYSYRLGVGFAVNEKVTMSAAFSGAYIDDLDLDGDRVEGTLQEPLSLRLATTIAKNGRLIEPFVDFGLTNDANDANLGIIWTY